MLRFSLAYLVAALALGVSLVFPSAPASLAAFGPTYLHLFTVGWVTQLIMGVVYWMFPKYSATHPRGHPALAWATMMLLNSSLLLRAIAEPMHALRPEDPWGWVLAISALLQWLAGLAFVANTWARVRER
jgi:hypothetical protein